MYYVKARYVDNRCLLREPNETHVFVVSVTTGTLLC